MVAGKIIITDVDEKGTKLNETIQLAMSSVTKRDSKLTETMQLVLSSGRKKTVSLLKQFNWLCHLDVFPWSSNMKASLKKQRAKRAVFELLIVIHTVYGYELKENYEVVII